MRILQINKFYFQGGPAGGVGKYLFDVKALLESRGHEVVPFAMQDPRNADNKYSCFFVSQSDFSRPRLALGTALRALYSREAQNKIKRLVQGTGPDVAHVHLIYHQISPSILKTLQELRVPVIMTVHDFKPFFPSPVISEDPRTCNNIENYRPGKFIRQKCVKNSMAASAFAVFENWVHKKMRLYYDYVDQYIAPSQYVFDKLVRLGVDQSKITLLPHFIECSEASETKKTVPYYGFLGRLAPEKDLITLLEAHRRSGAKLMLKIAGEGSFKKTLQNYISTHGIPKVEFVGGLMRNQVDEFICGSEFMVATSSVGETFGLTILEAFCQNKPVLAARAGAYAELVRDGDNGYLYSIGNAAELAGLINKLADDENLLAELSRRARQSLKGYLPESHLNKLEGLYRNLVKTEKIQSPRP